MSSADENDDASIEPAVDLPADKAAIAAGMPPVSVQKAQSREWVRTIVSLVILVATVACGVAVATAALFGSARTGQVADLVFTPLIGLAGVIIGFYFGGQDSTA